ncbi:Ig-like domain-containing protein [Nocardia sp. NPDC004068]|uniref:L,D-transpeptidase n=1 Tax=Nocardia sp. NPDC004068 TaxID=3364303 RepID=UPI003695C2C9
MSIWRVRRRSRGPFGAMAVLAVVALAATGCNNSGASEAGPVPQGPPVGELMRPKLVTPVADGAVGVAAGDPLLVRVDDGQLAGVTLSGPDGEVPGRMAPDGRSWTVAEPLAFGRSYRLQAEAVGLGGKSSSAVNFTTITPRSKTHPWLLPADEEVVGIGQPVAVQFDENIPDRRAAQDAIKITTVPPVEGAFYWVNNREVRWRPEHFWQPGTRVTIDVNTYGRDLGNGLVGDTSIHSTFTVGDAVVFTADDDTKMVTVERNGEVIRTMPTSMGKNSSPTDNGVYILSDRFDHMIMDSSTYGVAATGPNGYRTPVDWATRMSYSGIFMHSAPWSVGQQGYTNTSHGCLNLSPADARWVYETAKRGDIAIVKNTVAGTLSGVDGLGDWNIPWPEWKAGNVDR